jgi:vitamin B12 transporter
LSGTVFYDNFTDLIGFDIVTFRLKNFEEVRTSGLELEARVQPIPNLTVIGNYTFLSTEDKTTGDELLRRPRNSGGINIQYRWEKLQTNFNWNIVGDRFDLNDVTFAQVTNPGFNTADLVVSYDIIEQLQVYGRITNIFDEQYQEVFGFPSPDRAFFAGVRVKY